MKNILVKSLYELKSTNWSFRDRSNEPNLFSCYLEAHRTSLASFKKHLKGEWEFIYITDNYDTIHQGLHRTFFEIYKIWKDNAPCNILYTDPDTMAIAPVDIWNRYQHFMMFNFSDPRSFYKPNKYQLKFSHFFNAGVRYFPATMSTAIWEQGLAMANEWDFDSYDTEQIILNHMFWNQGPRLSEVLLPKLNYQAPWMDPNEMWRQDLWNGVDIEECQIIHLHGSRGIEEKLRFMKSLSAL